MNRLCSLWASCFRSSVSFYVILFSRWYLLRTFSFYFEVAVNSVLVGGEKDISTNVKDIPLKRKKMLFHVCECVFVVDFLIRKKNIFSALILYGRWLEYISFVSFHVWVGRKPQKLYSTKQSEKTLKLLFINLFPLPLTQPDFRSNFLFYRYHQLPKIANEKYALVSPENIS